MGLDIYPMFVLGWKFRVEADNIRTTFFLGTFMYGSPKAGDDIHEVKWFNVDTLTPEMLVPEHRQLRKALFWGINPKEKT